MEGLKKDIGINKYTFDKDNASYGKVNKIDFSSVSDKFYKAGEVPKEILPSLARFQKPAEEENELFSIEIEGGSGLESKVIQERLIEDYKPLRDLLEQAIPEASIKNLSIHGRKIVRKHRMCEGDFRGRKLDYIDINANSLDKRKNIDEDYKWTKRKAADYLNATKTDDLRSMNFEQLTTWALLDTEINGDSTNTFMPIAESMRMLYQTCRAITADKEKDRGASIIALETCIASVKDSVAAYRATHKGFAFFAKGRKRYLLCDLLEGDAFSEMIHSMYDSMQISRDDVLKGVDRWKNQVRDEINIVPMDEDEDEVEEIVKGDSLLNRQAIEIKGQMNRYYMAHIDELYLDEEDSVDGVVDSADYEMNLDCYGRACELYLGHKPENVTKDDVDNAMNRFKAMAENTDEFEKFCNALIEHKFMMCMHEMHGHRLESIKGFKHIDKYLKRVRKYVISRYHVDMIANNGGASVVGYTERLGN